MVGVETRGSPRSAAVPARTAIYIYILRVSELYDLLKKLKQTNKIDNTLIRATKYR